MKRLIATFTRSQIASAIGTAADFTLFAILVKVLNYSPVWSVGVSATLGAVIIFQLARHWAFRAGNGGLRRQLLLFGLCAVISIALNTAAVILLLSLGYTELIARVAAAVLVAVLFNFPFLRLVVFAAPRGPAK